MIAISHFFMFGACESYTHGGCDDDISDGYELEAKTGPSTGGTDRAPLPPLPDLPCDDESSTSGTIEQRYGFESIRAGDGKTYVLASNWWGNYDGQSISYDGLSFTIEDNTPWDGDHMPAGYPTLFLGSYRGYTTRNSRLPKSVSSITRIDSVLHTNVGSLNTDDFNVAYDLWFTADGSPLGRGEDSPGAGGSYLMIWLYEPALHRPIGSVVGSARSVGGAPGTWNVFVGTKGAARLPVVTYVGAEKSESLEVDLNVFIEDGVDNNLGIRSDHHLSVIFAGFEIWSGAAGARVRRFCIDVQ